MGTSGQSVPGASLDAFRPTPTTAPAPSAWVLAFAADHGLEVSACAWVNGIGGTTWQLEGADGTSYLKVGPEHPEWDPGVLAQRLDFLAEHVTVPAVLSLGVGEDGPFLHSAAVPGRDGARSEWWATAMPGLTRETARLTDQASAVVGTLVEGLGRALRAFHDAVPADECPWDWGIDDTAALDPGEAVVCHGDACIPNLLLDVVDDSAAGQGDGRGERRLVPSGYVDVASCGIASRWADLAAATLSLGWNLPGDADAHTARFLAAYGIGTDLPEQPGRLEDYRSRWMGE